ncbi:MAG: hypothetical protein PHD31_01025 [Candidatus Pacebacteria bacterium]|nr:hypothetical protein [Candidatus Paceibacterota bacterium]
MKKNTIIFSILILIILVLVGSISWNKMSFSKEALKLEILGPEKTAIGENIEYIVKFKNNGTIRLEKPELTFEYPEGTILETGEKIKVMNSDQLGGDIYPGEERTFKFESRMLGKEGDTRIAKARVSFQPKDLKTRSEAATTFTTILGAIPLDLTLDIPSKAATGKAMTLKVAYSSNVDYTLKDLTCYIQYPTDFEFLYSQPKGLDNTQWDIPVLGEAGFGRIEVSGILNGQSMEQKAFKVRIGIWQNGEFILLKEVVKGVEIIAPSLYITEKINGSENYIASPGDQLHYEITFRNVGDNNLEDLVLISRLEGTHLDLNSIKAIDGTNQKGDNSIVWDGTKVPELKLLEAGQVGKIEFWVNIEPQWTMKSLNDKNPIIKNKITLGESRQEFLTKINSVITANQYIYVESKYFENSGPYPLEKDQKTFLTVEWKATNSYNDLENVKMRTVLPESVTFEGKTYPEGTEVTFDENTSEVMCDIGSFAAGTGVIKDPKICAFQISVQPQITEKDIFLLGAMQLSGTDQWTSKELTVKTDELYAETVGE